MRRLGGMVLLLALACQLDKKPEASRAREAEPTPTDEAEPAPSRFATPWQPRNEAARFFSRPAENWNEHALELADYALDVAVADGMATVSLDVQVTNPTAEQAEAVIELPVPPGAAVTGASLWMGDEPMAGVMLGSARAQQIYDRIVSRRRDPLLVAWGAPDMLKLSIFPLEAKQTRRFRVTWIEPAASDAQWVPSFYERGKRAGAPKRITVNGAPVERDGDWVTVPRTAPLARGDFRLAVQRETRPSHVALVVDTGVGALDAELAWREVESFVQGMESQADISIIAADWLLRELGTGRELADFTAAKSALLGGRAVGLFDQRQALTRARELVGDRGAIAVLSLQAVAAPPDERFDTPVYWLNPNGWFSSRDIIDFSGGRAFVRGAELVASVRPLIRPDQAGFDWLPLDTATGHVAWIGYRSDAQVDAEAAVGAGEALFYRAMLRRGEIPLNKIVSPRTSILVLESEQHYKQWGVKDEDGKLVREGTPAGGTISGLLDGADSGGFGMGGAGPGGGGSGWSTIGTGDLGTIGHGSATGSGYGMGGRSSSGRRSSVPRVRIGSATVEGNLDENIVRRVLRRHLARVRYCYEKELLRHEDLAGTLTVDLMITAEGRVARVAVSMDHAKGKGTSTCVERTLARMRFPRPRGGGIVKAKFPFVLAPVPASLWSRARKLLVAGKPGYEAKIGAIFGGQAPTNRTDLAWWLVENHLRSWETPVSGYATVAELLRVDASGAPADVDDARRVLSEAARRSLDAVAEIYEQWGLAADAERVRTQWPHGGGYYGTGLGTIETRVR